MPVFVGRAKELEALHSALDQAIAGRGSCVIVSGEAGVGKSYLLSALRRQATEAGWQTLEGHCFEQDLSVPYAPLAFALHSFFDHLTRHQLLESLGAAAREFARILPELNTEIDRVEPGADLDPEAEKRRFFEVLIRWLFGLAGATPLLLMVEDLHWSDDGSLEFLRFLARRISAHPILLMLTYRSPLLQARLVDLMTNLDREAGVLELRLDPLSRAETGKLANHLLELEDPLPNTFIDQIYDLTGGNPFFIGEILNSVAAAEIDPNQWWRNPSFEVRIPRSIKRLVQQRLRGLSRDARHTVNLAAISGRIFDFSILQDLTGFREQRLLEAIKELVAAGLVLEESAEQFAFRHALTREALYDRLLIRERRALHAETGEAIEKRYVATLEAHWADLAYHYYEAGVWPKALTYARLAGEKARALYSPHAAAEQFTRAIEAAEKIGGNSLWSLYRLRAQAFNVAGDFNRAQADYEAALAAAQSLPSEDAEWQLLLDLAEFWVARDDARVGEYAHQALALAQNLERRAAVAQSLNWLGHWHLRTGRCEDALQQHQQALDILEPLDDPHTLTTTLELLATAHSWCGSHEQAAAAYQKAIVLLYKLDDRQRLASSLILLNVLTLDVAQLQEAEQIARDIGWRGGEAFALVQLGNTLALKGQYGNAAQAMQRGLEIAEETGNLERRNNAYLSLGFLYTRLLAPDLAKGYLQKGLAAGKEMGSAFHIFTGTSYLASVYLLEERLADAKALLASLPRLPEQWGPILLVVRTAEIEVALAEGDERKALLLGEGVRRLAQHPEKLMGMVASDYSWFLRTYGQALILASQLEEAKTALSTAQKMMVKQDILTELWRIQCTKARLYKAAHRWREGAATRAEARQLVQQLANSIPDEVLRQSFLERALEEITGEASPHRKQAASDPFDSLTPRQREVVAKVALGKTNAEIAEALSITTKTVEAHVSRILTRLAFSSRSQIAVWAVEHGLKPTSTEE
jgi:predicted ATPase/DNA-binding CsgD family transcriptional regulator